MSSELIQILNPDGNCDEKAVTGLSKEEMIKMYRLMVLTRLWNEKALSLQRQGRLGTLGSVKGQEAANVGMALPLKEEDWFVPAFREYGALFARGISLRDQFMFWGGDERGGKIPDDIRITNTCITVGAHLLHAVGIAMAAKIRGEKVVALSSSGDGSTSEGDFHEALNWAGVFKVPVVFVIQNNHWAISLPVEKQTATKTLAEKAGAYAIDGVRVDGNDVFAVYTTVKKYADAARNEHKPALIELVTYRMGDHTTADDASRYRSKDLLSEWEKKDPIKRMQIYLMKKKGWTEQQNKNLENECTQDVENAVREYETAESADPLNMFKHIYSEMPWHLKEQMDELSAFSSEGGNE